MGVFSPGTDPPTPVFYEGLRAGRTKEIMTTISVAIDDREDFPLVSVLYSFPFRERYNSILRLKTVVSSKCLRIRKSKTLKLVDYKNR